MIFGNQIDDNGVLIRSANDKTRLLRRRLYVRKANGKYRYVWLYKVRAKPVTESYATKEGTTITRQTGEVEWTAIKRTSDGAIRPLPMKARAALNSSKAATFLESVYSPTFTPEEDGAVIVRTTTYRACRFFGGRFLYHCIGLMGGHSHDHLHTEGQKVFRGFHLGPGRCGKWSPLRKCTRRSYTWSELAAKGKEVPKDAKFTIADAMDIMIRWFCILFQNQFTPDDVLDNYPVDRLDARHCPRAHGRADADHGRAFPISLRRRRRRRRRRKQQRRTPDAAGLHLRHTTPLSSGWKFDEIDRMDMLGFLRVRAWQARRENQKKTPRRAYIDEVWPDLK